GFINLAYAWTDASDWGISINWTLTRFVSLRTSFDNADFEAESVVLAFDESLALHHISRGFLFDLVPSAQESTAAGRMVQRSPR
ncbi:MAG: hypothetical protein KDB80_03990, partial [Planctomycetes bacterium]|nr:hypothetical protein [Planctomycetota bacterium]